MLNMANETFYIYYQPNSNDSRYSYLAKHLEGLLKFHKWVKDVNSPNYIFLIGFINVNIPQNITIFRIIFSSDVIYYYDEIANTKDFFLIIKDIDTKITLPSRNCTRIISYPIPFINTTYNPSISKTRTNILVSCQEDISPNYSIFKLIRPFNKLHDKFIVFHTKHKNIKKSLNANISIQQYKLKNIPKLVSSSDIVVGSGFAIVEAIIQHKPYVIVGEYGYGGIPDERNIYSFYKSFFTGSIGGSLCAPIPESLLIEDIQTIASDLNKYYCSNIGNQLSNKSYSDLENAICSFLEKKELVFNTDYTIILNNNTYLLYNRYTKKNITELDKTTANLLVQGDISKINDSIIQILKQNKILI